MTGFQFAKRCSRSSMCAPRPCGLPSLAQLFDRAHLSLLDVGAAAEGPAGAAEDPDLRVVVVVEREQRLAQLLDHVVVQRIEHFGAIERDVSDPVPLCRSRRTA